MPGYHVDGWDPPAPIVRATLRGPSGLSSFDVPLLIDTGADVSVVPHSAAEAIGVPVDASATPVEYLSGARELLDRAQLTIEFDRFRFDGVFLVTEAAYGILGRNILNLLLLTLDGPRLTWSVLPSNS